MSNLLQTLRDKTHLYKPRPFLTLNDAVEEENLRKLIRTMGKHGIGGFYAHARSGLTVPYLSEEWFRMTDICADECEKRGMQFWVYDEMGWPSGSAGGLVTAKDKKYSSRWLELFASPKEIAGRLVACYDKSYRPCEEAKASYFLCEIENDGYIDVLDEEAVRVFIDCTYEKYRARYKNKIVGFFTDEPQYGMLRTPYTAAVEKMMEEGGDRIREFGISLFFDTGNFSRIRRRYYGAIAELFRRNYIGQIAKWCERYGYKLTGHVLEEKSLDRQILSCGDILSDYSLMQVPGMDWLGQDIGANGLAPRQVSSVCKQFGKKENVSESFACVGYGISLQALRSIADWEISNGITDLCYVIPYSVRGRRKRDYPSGIVTYQPYFELADGFNLWLSRFCAMSAESENTAQVLLVSPLSKARESFRVGAGNEWSDRLDAAVNALERHHVSYHVTNADILRGHARAEGGRLFVGDCSYSCVLCFAGEKSEVLDEFRAQGGEALVVGDDTRWQETAQKYRDCLLYGKDCDSLRTARFAIGGEEAVSVQNISQARVRFSLADGAGRRGHRLDLLSLHTSYAREYELAAGECALFVFGGEEKIDAFETLALSADGWECSLSEQNVLLLDRADCYKDGELYAAGIAPILLQDKLVRDGQNCRLKLVYRARSRVPLCGAYLGVENVERYTISVNGVSVPSRSCGRFVADCISRVALPDLPAGEIEIALEFDFSIPAEARRVLLGEDAIESDFNRLQDLPEVENIFLIGDFSVRGLQKESDMLVSDGTFILDRFEMPRDLSGFGLGGLPFYVGEIVAKKKVKVCKSDQKILFGCTLRGMAARLFVNGQEAGDLLWDRRLDITPLLFDGENEIELHLFNDLRNVFGPHHNKFKDPHMVGFTTFTDAPGWCDPQERLWTDTYYLKEYGVGFSNTNEEETEK